MLRIRGPAAMALALGQPLNAHLHALLAERAAQLGPGGLQDTYIAVAEPGDSFDKVADEIGYPVVDEGEPTFETVRFHPGGWFEAVWSFGDLTHVVIAQDDDRTDATLIALFRDHAVYAPAAAASARAG